MIYNRKQGLRACIGGIQIRTKYILFSLNFSVIMEWIWNQSIDMESAINTQILVECSRMVD